MATRVCWQCGVSSYMRMAGDATSSSFETRVASAFFICANCGWPSLGFQEIPQSGVGDLSSWLAASTVITWYPNLGVGRDYPNVPDHIASAAGEAHRCHSIDAYRAAVLLARSVVEATAKDKGITTGNLVYKIDTMEAQDLIRAIVKDAAHEIRYLGNEMAHGDFVESVTNRETLSHADRQ